MTTAEFEIVAHLRKRFPLVGDDAAVVEPPRGPLLLAADAIVEGVDFTPPFAADEVGYRAILVNASDIAAMGGRLLHALVTICAPAGVDVFGLIDGVADGARAHGCEVAGGDLSSTSGPLVVSVAITGTVDDGAPVGRDGARDGDAVYVTGPLGFAAANNYRFGRVWPRARIEEGIAARKAGATAMIDVSDGFVADLRHVCEASGVGVELGAMPVAGGATEAQARAGGDDYELIFTLAPEVDPPPGSIRVGTIVRDPTALPDGSSGWQHRFS